MYSLLLNPHSSQATHSLYFQFLCVFVSNFSKDFPSDNLKKMICFHIMHRLSIKVGGLGVGGLFFLYACNDVGSMYVVSMAVKKKF